jgi:hypothetical protein
MGRSRGSTRGGDRGIAVSSQASWGVRRWQGGTRCHRGRPQPGRQGGRGGRRGVGRRRAQRPSPCAMAPRSPRRLSDGMLVGLDLGGDLGADPFGQHRVGDPLGSSDQVRAGHPGSGQRHRRLAHTSTTGRPASVRSRTTTRRRPWPTARTPHVSHQARRSVASTRAATRRSPHPAADRSRRTRRVRAPPTRRYRRVPSGVLSI